MREKVPARGAEAGAHERLRAICLARGVGQGRGGSILASSAEPGRRRSLGLAGAARAVLKKFLDLPFLLSGTVSCFTGSQRRFLFLSLSPAACSLFVAGIR